MLKKFAFALVSTALIAGPALAQSNSTNNAPAIAAQPAKPAVSTDGKAAAQPAKPEVKADVKADAKADAKSGAKADVKSDVKADAKASATAKPATQTPEIKKDAKPEKKTQLHKGKSTKHGKKPVEKTLG